MSLVDVTVDDLDWIREAADLADAAGAASGWQRSYRWSLRGRSATPGLVRGLAFEAVLWQQALVVDEGSGRTPAGLVQVSDVNPASGCGHLSLLVADAHADARREPLAGFVSRAFRELGLRKLCLDAVEGELDVEAHLGGSACLVGRLVDHERRGEGEYADLLVHELWPPSTQ